jgi:exodeoxyribonuclease-5
MELTRKQEEGLRIAVERYHQNEPYTVISGYAGTGKSTLIKFIISALDVNPERVAYIAYTGKAAQVLRNKGCPTAMTAHRLLYKSLQRADGTFIHISRESLNSDCDIVVVDEVSMLPKQMWELLLSHNVYVIACGDPGQLPPIGEENGILDHPHIFLDEIMRQAAESEIIRLSADIRTGKIIKPYKGSEINVVRQRDLCDGMFTWADQILCGKNITRHTMNNYYRNMRYGEDIPAPIVGDKVICLKNNWDKITATGDALVNGTIGTIEEIATYPNPWLNPMCIIDFAPETIDETDPRDQVFHELLMDYKLITTKEATVNKENFRMFPKQLRPEQFDYGYCITVHKSQGSEYDKVLVLEEMLKRADHARWLYTAVTRASQKLTLVLKD